MKFISKNTTGIYRFNRKIPNSSKIFAFTLQTKNKKVAQKIVSSFLVTSTAYFNYLQTLSKEEMSMKFDEVQKVLNDYKRKALEEYSELEEKRHEHFKTKSGDGSNPESLKFWATELHQFISNRTDRQLQEMGKAILSRATPELKTLYASLTTPKDKKTFIQLLLKTESSIMKKDYERYKKYFDLDFEEPLSAPKIEYVSEVLAETIEENFVPAVIKTKIEYFEDYLKTKVVENKGGSKDKILSPIETLLQCSEVDYLNEYTLEDYDLFMKTLAYTPAHFSNGRRPRAWNYYKGNYVLAAEDFRNGDMDNFDYDDFEFQGIKTVREKLTEVRNFLRYVVSKGGLEKSVFDIELKDYDNPDRFSSKLFDGIVKDEKLRLPFSTSEIENMFDFFIENKFFKGKNIAFSLIPTIALFSGMRLEEIAKLKTKDIIVEDNVYCFDITPPAKTKSSIRKVPIHSFLIENMNLLKYVSKRKNEGQEMLFDLKSSYNKNRGMILYGADFGEEFQEMRNQFVSARRIEEDLITFHSLRHTFSTRLSMGNVDKINIGQLLGHKKSKKDSQTPGYINPSVSQRKELIEKLDIRDLTKSLLRFTRKFKESKLY